jgi:hypothetical protein
MDSLNARLPAAADLRDGASSGISLTQNQRSSPVHRSVAAMAFFSAAYSLTTAAMYLMASQGHNYSFFTRLNWIGWLAIPAGLQFLYYLRPEASRTARMVGYILYPYWAVVLALCLFTDLIVTPHYSLILLPEPSRPLEILFHHVTAALLMLLWLIIEVMRIRRHLTE